MVSLCNRVLPGSTFTIKGVGAALILLCVVVMATFNTGYLPYPAHLGATGKTKTKGRTDSGANYNDAHREGRKHRGKSGTLSNRENSEETMVRTGSGTQYDQDAAGTVRHNLIVSTYMRSGSTTVGNILGSAASTFYTWEPLWLVSKMTYYRGRNQICSHSTPVCARIRENNKVENFNVPPTNATLAYLQSLLNCGFNRYPEFMTHMEHSGGWTVTKRDFQFYHFKDWVPFRSCQEDGEETLTTCLEKAVPSCLASSHRVIKLLRMALDTQEVLLANNPDLKIIHLVRDPRAIMNFHIHTGFYKRFVSTPEKIKDDTITLCERMLYDIEAGQLLSDKYPSRFRVMHYEDMGNVTRFREEMFNFIGLVSAKVNSNAGKHYTSRSSFHPTSYRTSLSWDIVHTMDRYCKPVLEHFGYTIYESEQHLRDISRPSPVYPLRFSIKA